MLDRTGEPVDETHSEYHDPRCRNGWLGHDDELRPVPCLYCRNHLLSGTKYVNDSAEQIPSTRAQAAIARAEYNESRKYQ